MKAIEKSTGKVVRVREVSYGLFRNEKTGQTYWKEELDPYQRPTMAAIATNLKKVKITAYGRTLSVHDFTLTVIPTVSIQKGDGWLDMELLWLSWGVGIRLSK